MDSMICIVNETACEKTDMPESRPRILEGHAQEAETRSGRTPRHGAGTAMRVAPEEAVGERERGSLAPGGHHGTAVPAKGLAAAPVARLAGRFRRLPAARFAARFLQGTGSGVPEDLVRRTRPGRCSASGPAILFRFSAVRPISRAIQ